MSIKILDCTLRDGGYINDWGFTTEQTNRVLGALKSANIDVVECGYLNSPKGKCANSTLFDRASSIDTILKEIDDQNSQKVVMINYGDYDIDLLTHQNETLIDGIRLAFHKKDAKGALEFAQKTIALGYKLYFQPMVTKNYRDIEFLQLIDDVNKLDIYAFYIVDSFGSMQLDEFEKYLVLANSNLKSNVALGYHSHNNMQLAFANAISMTQTNFKREIILDASIYGIGRGAGNLNTELIADYLNKTFDREYETLPLLEIIDEFLSSLMKKNPWGFSPAQFLSASYNCHPNYATHLINKNTNHIVGVKKILDKLPMQKRSSFDKAFIEQLYIDSIIEAKTALKNTFLLNTTKKVLLIASGKSVSECQSLIEEKIHHGDYITISLNHVPTFDVDYHFFTNQKRFDAFSSQIDLDKTVIANNIASDLDIYSVLDFSKFAFIDGRLITNVAMVAINVLIAQGIQSVEIAGLDGYRLYGDNYNYDETSFISDKKTLFIENNLTRDALKILQKKIKIEFITPSIFQDEIKLKILGVIPARYKSTRFEGKPLCIIKEIPMIKRTYRQAKKSQLLDDLVVATDSDKIKNYCESENIPVVMTSSSCLTGTDRIAEVAHLKHYDLYVNIQGDEPIIDPSSIDEVVEEFKKYGNDYIAYNLYKVIIDESEITSDTIIKVIVNENNELMYMSRLGTPYNKTTQEAVYKKQVCVYGFTKKALQLFSSRDKTINEQFEDIEILRFLDMGYRVKMRETNVDSIAVDIPDDIEKVENFLNENGLE